MAGPGPNRFYSSAAVQTSLNGGINNSTLSMTVGSTTGFPGSFPYTLSIDQNLAGEELVTVTGASGLVLTIVRGVDGTTGVLHNNGASVVHVMSARDLAEPQAHLGAYDAVHGLSVGSLVVGTTDTQVLTNKTLTTPALTAPTMTSPAVTQTAVGSVGIKVTGLVNATGDLFTAIDGTAASVFRIQQNGASGAGHVLIAPTDTGGAPALTINSPTGVGPFAFQINGVDQWKANAAGNLASAGVGNALDLTTMTGAKPIIGPQLLAYVPAFSGTGFSLGNGTATGGYIQYGKLTFFEGYLTIGSTTTLTTLGNVLVMTLPLTVFNYSLSSVMYLRPGGVVFSGTAIPSPVGAGGASVGLYVSDTGGPGFLHTIDRTIPINPPAAGDIIFVRGWYQATT